MLEQCSMNIVEIKCMKFKFVAVDKKRYSNIFKLMMIIEALTIFHIYIITHVFECIDTLSN